MIGCAKEWALVQGADSSPVKGKICILPSPHPKIRINSFDENVARQIAGEKEPYDIFSTLPGDCIKPAITTHEEGSECLD